MPEVVVRSFADAIRVNNLLSRVFSLVSRPQLSIWSEAGVTDVSDMDYGADDMGNGADQDVSWGGESADPALTDVGPLEDLSNSYPTSSPDDPNGGYPTSSPDGEGQAPSDSTDESKDVPTPPTGPGPYPFEPPPEWGPPTLDLDRIGNPPTYPTDNHPNLVQTNPFPHAPYLTIAQQYERQQREDDVRRGPFIGALQFGLNGNLDAAEMQNGLSGRVSVAAALGKTVSGRPGAVPNWINDPGALPAINDSTRPPVLPAQTKVVGPASPPSSAGGPRH